MRPKCPFLQGIICLEKECALFLANPSSVRGGEGGICAITQTALSLKQGVGELNRIRMSPK